MNFKHPMSIGMALILAAGMLASGCAKKEVVGAATPAGGAAAATAGGATIKPSTSPAPGTAAAAEVQEPSSHSVYFAFDSAKLDAAAQAILDANIAWLKAHPAHSITIEGNCDERGSREYNLALGQRRADSVRDYLVAHGIPADKIRTVSFGEERPVCTGTGEACWAQNRRADIVVQ